MRFYLTIRHNLTRFSQYGQATRNRVRFYLTIGHNPTRLAAAVAAGAGLRSRLRPTRSAEADALG